MKNTNENVKPITYEERLKEANQEIKELKAEINRCDDIISELKRRLVQYEKITDHFNVISNSYRHVALELRDEIERTKDRYTADRCD